MTILFKNIIAIIYLKLVSCLFRSKAKRIENNLLFVNTEQIGDIVVSSAILEYENGFNKYDNVYFLIRSEYLELLKNYKGRIRILSLDTQRFKYSILYNFKFVKKIKGLNIKEVYNINPSRGQINEIVIHLTGALIKFATISNSYYLGKYFLNYWNKKYDSILFPMEINEYSKIYMLLELFKVNNEVERLNVFLNKNSSFSKLSSYVSISPYCSNSIKDWETQKFINLVSQLETRSLVYIICSSRQKDRAIIDFGLFENVIVTDIKLSLVADLIKQSNLFIGNDSGLTHLAIKLGVKTIAIIGGGTFGRFFPIPGSGKNVEYKFKDMDCFGCNWKCVYDAPKCMEVEVNI